MTDPFFATLEVPVAGGRLKVAHAGSALNRAETLVLVVHGITASHVAWRAVTRELISEAGVCVLAPDLRGRGGSARLPGPYGSEAHVADLLAVLDHVAAPRVVLGGHSMGAYVAARFAAEHPERVSSLVLVDGGPALPAPADADPDEVLAKTLGPAVERLAKVFPTRDDYVAMWRAHPALASSWNADIDAYVRYDIEDAPDAEHPLGVRSVVAPDAVRTDGRQLLLDEPTRTALQRVRAPTWLLRAPRGMLDDERPLLPPEVLDEVTAALPGARVETIADTNHYTILLGEGPGAARVAAAIRAAAELHA
jgi:pimeloyl-ACP methyl ester carboxylesterase